MLTRRLAEVGELIGIPVIDHVVVGRGSFASLRDLGLLVSE
jgi:DNA repair protein RadC